MIWSEPPSLERNSLCVVFPAWHSRLLCNVKIFKWVHSIHLSLFFHCLLAEKWKCWSFSGVWVFVTPWTVALARLLCPWVHCHSLLQRNLLNPGSEPRVSCITDSLSPEDKPLLAEKQAIYSTASSEPTSCCNSNQWATVVDKGDKLFPKCYISVIPFLFPF